MNNTKTVESATSKLQIGVKYAVTKSQNAVLMRLVRLVGGFCLGAINGAFGSGGGMIAVPLLRYATGANEKSAHATAIAVILPLSVISTAVYALNGAVLDTFAWAAIGGVVMGGVLGALALKKASNAFLTFLFYGVMLFAGLKMLLN